MGRAWTQSSGCSLEGNKVKLTIYFTGNSLMKDMEAFVNSDQLQRIMTVIMEGSETMQRSPTLREAATPIRGALVKCQHCGAENYFSNAYCVECEKSLHS
jgi:hypothetical protein